ncbi:MAG TPA: hypothetical protein VJK50_03965 [Patescibacteria group bacterium]|nr:hypothetical protein [Patescibacteria group bacterium]
MRKTALQISVFFLLSLLTATTATASVETTHPEPNEGLLAIMYHFDCKMGQLSAIMDANDISAQDLRSLSTMQSIVIDTEACQAIPDVITRARSMQILSEDSAASQHTVAEPVTSPTAELPIAADTVQTASATAAPAPSVEPASLSAAMMSLAINPAPQPWPITLLLCCAAAMLSLAYLRIAGLPATAVIEPTTDFQETIRKAPYLVPRPEGKAPAEDKDKKKRPVLTVPRQPRRKEDSLSRTSETLDRVELVEEWEMNHRTYRTWKCLHAGCTDILHIRQVENPTAVDHATTDQTLLAYHNIRHNPERKVLFNPDQRADMFAPKAYGTFDQSCMRPSFASTMREIFANTRVWLTRLYHIASGQSA